MGEPGGDAPTTKGETEEASVRPLRVQRRGIISRIWRGIFGVRSEDYEKKLHRLTKEEAAVHARMKRRAQSSRKSARNLIMLSVTFEVVAVAIACIAVKSLDFTGPMKLSRTLPAILLPCLSYIVYSLLEGLSRILERKDQKSLERLRAERKAKIDELKERTNYYTMQQLIQRYDLDPAAKVAAATALASRLGAESGLKVKLGDEPANHLETSKNNNNIEQAQPNVLMQRKQHSIMESTVPKLPEILNDVGSDLHSHINTASGPIIVEHYRGLDGSNGGWVDRIVALLLAVDSSKCYALICGNCHRHNGLARKEEFPHTTYYCPHCHALNTSKQIGDQELSPGALGGSRASAIAGAEAGGDVVESTQELR